MDINNFPKITAILRGYSIDEAMFIMDSLNKYSDYFSVEVTTNSDNYLKIIQQGNLAFGDKLLIGAGTVLNLQHAKESIDAGAKFLLGPEKFSDDIFDYAKNKNVITVPAAMSSSEISEMFSKGADIVKVFPANVVGINYFKQLAGPYGKQNLMAVGGMNIDNIASYFSAGAKFVGIGSAMFNKDDIKNRNSNLMLERLERYVSIIEEVCK